MNPRSIPVIATDVLILGAGGAGLCAALHAADAGKKIKIHLVTKAIIGKGGCSRMVQGGYNVVLNPADSFEKHFMDTLKGGQFINNQDLAWQLIRVAPERIKEMETKYGCFFDRNPDGSIHQKPFAGQSFDRTVHKGDLTGIEHRALELLRSKDGSRIVGALLMDMGTGEFVIAHARTTLVCTGGGPTMYKLFAPSLDKSADGISLCYRAGAEMIDMEMVQFHPTGLIVKGSNTSGTLLEEGLRGAGAQLFNALGERYMERYAPDVKERATRDVVSRSGFPHRSFLHGRSFHQHPVPDGSRWIVCRGGRCGKHPWGQPIGGKWDCGFYRLRRNRRRLYGRGRGRQGAGTL
jgi:succinate dehydrogenase/fumarate reductase flavoprotein subunit